MKVAFVGKGGSGKTTLTALFARHLAVAGLPVLAIDADINQHLATTLGLSPEDADQLPPLGIEMERLKSYLRGSNARIKSTFEMVKTTPPGAGSRLLQVQAPNAIYDYFERAAGGVRIMATGPFTAEDLGVKCYHSKVGAVELLLNHLIDAAKEYVLVDMTAGADSFASGLFTRFDVTFLVVEPTLKSISVYHQYSQYARDYGVRLVVIGNKIESLEDVDFLQEHIGSDLETWFEKSDFVRAIERGQNRPLDEIEPFNRQALVQIQRVVDNGHKDWPKFYRQMLEFHRKNAASWANEATGAQLEEQIDPDFVLAA